MRGRELQPGVRLRMACFPPSPLQRSIACLWFFGQTSAPCPPGQGYRGDWSNDLLAHACLEDCTLCDLIWDEVKDDDYEAFCQHCEIHVFLETPEERDRLFRIGNLTCVRGKQIAGRLTQSDALASGKHLRSGDSLRPSRQLLDMGKLEKADLRITIIFLEATIRCWWSAGS